MGGKAVGGSETKKIPCHRAQAIANMICLFLTSRLREDEDETDTSLALRADFAGSLRRGLPDVGDIDIVVRPNVHWSIIKDNIISQLHGRIVSAGPSKIVYVSTVEDVQVDLYLTRSDGADWGSQFQMWTGSKEYNIRLRALAKRKGMSLSEHGIKLMVDGEQTLKTFATERELYDFLGATYRSPDQRSR